MAWTYAASGGECTQRDSRDRQYKISPRVFDCTSDHSMAAMDDATLTPDAGAPSPPLPALLPPRALEATLAEQTADPARRPLTPYGPVAARGWDVAHAAALRVLSGLAPASITCALGRA